MAICRTEEELHSIYFETVRVLRPLSPQDFPLLPKASEVNHLLLWPTFNSLCSRADLADRLPGVVVLLDALKQPREVAYEDDSSSDLEEPFMTSPPKNGYQPSTKQSCAHRAGETHQSRTILLHTSR